MQIREYKIKHLNKKYFQKSTFFLYPLLKIPKTIIPIGTYLEWDGRFNIDENIFICRFKKFKTQAEQKVEINSLIKHPLYLDYYELEDDTIAYVFTFETFKDVVNLFLKGKYSKFSEATKNKIISFYRPETHTRSIMKSYLYPEFFYEIYSDLLNVNIALLEEVSELIDKPDNDKETLKLKVKNIDLNLIK